MALINCVKYDGPPTGPDGEDVPWLVYKVPSADLVLGSQLIVNRSQEAVLFHDGNVLDVFGPGTHTLSVANLPLSQRVIDLPSNAKLPISTEVYFVNKTATLDVKWGTFEPLQIIDPTHRIIVRVRGYGQFIAKISDARNFVSQIVGVLHGNQDLDYETLSDYLRRSTVAELKDTIAGMMTNKKTSIVDIIASVDSVSIACREKVASEFDRFGVEVLSFYIESISIPEEDMAEVRELQKKRARSLAAEYEESRNKGDLTRSKLFCADLVLLAAKQGDYTEMLKCLSALKGYAKAEEKAEIESLIKQISYRKEQGMEMNEELLSGIKVLTYQVQMK